MGKVVIIFLNFYDNAWKGDSNKWSGSQHL
jgi:hypothetical protein